MLFLAVADSKRVRLQQAARAQLGLAAAQVLPWAAYLQRPNLLQECLQNMLKQQPQVLLKIEPPSEDPLAQHLLLQIGASVQGLGGIPPAALEYAQLRDQHLWFAGFAAQLQQLAAQLQPFAERVRLLNSVPQILLMGDKLACQQHLQKHGVPVPELFGSVRDFAHLQAIMDQHRLERIFLKARYGSSAAGVLAYRRTRDGREQAITSAQLQPATSVESGASAGKIFNVKRIQYYQERADIAQLVDALCAQQSYAERWLSKPRVGKAHFDLRVVCLAGQARHSVARVGGHIMTNLHLDNQRAAVHSLLSATEIAQLERSASQAAACFPDSQVIGFDLVVNAGRVHVLEANAFGDLLPGLLYQGEDTYLAQQRLLQT